MHNQPLVQHSPLRLRELFLLDPNVIFLNHGSFGACPQPVFEAYQHWQRELERQPVEFIGRRYDGLMNDSRSRLAAYLHTERDNLVYIHNATGGINAIAQSLFRAKRIGAGDEILTTDHEYGACLNAWQFWCELSGTRIVPQHIPLPYTDPMAMVEQFWAGVTPRTKVIYLSHITSPTGVIFPAAELCKRAREAGIISVIDGAHAPAQIPLDLEAVGADFYTGNLHKWLCTPKGTAFLYARPEYQALLHPILISWGYSDMTPNANLAFTTARGFVERHQFQGTQDPSGWLSVPAAIDFQCDYQWDAVRQACHQLAHAAQTRWAELSGAAPVVGENLYAQMVILPLPPATDVIALKTRLYDDYRIEIPLTTWNGSHFARMSAQGYTTPEDADALLKALQATVLA